MLTKRQVRSLGKVRLADELHTGIMSRRGQDAASYQQLVAIGRGEYPMPERCAVVSYGRTYPALAPDDATMLAVAQSHRDAAAQAVAAYAALGEYIGKLATLEPSAIVARRDPDAGLSRPVNAIAALRHIAGALGNLSSQFPPLKSDAA
jgi:hypothetical protein